VQEWRELLRALVILSGLLAFATLGLATKKWWSPEAVGTIVASALVALVIYVGVRSGQIRWSSVVLTLIAVGFLALVVLLRQGG
jgi:hypothetical protein